METKNIETASSKLSELNAKKKLLYHLVRGSYSGLVFTFLGCLFINLASVIVKKITYVSPAQLIFVQNFGTLVWSIPIVVFTGEYVMGPEKHRKTMILSCLCGTTSLYLNYMSFRYLPLAEALIILSTTPAVVTIGARLFLKEPCGLVESCALVLTFIGFVVSVRLPELIHSRSGFRFTSEYVSGIGMAIAGVFCLSGAYLTLRKLKDVHYSVISTYIGFIGVIEACCLMGAFGSFQSPYCGWDPLLILFVALFSFVGYILIMLAIQSEAVAIVSIVRFALTIVMGLVFQVIFFDDYPDLYNYCGALVVIIAVSAIGLKKFVQTLSEASHWRIKLKFMLL